MQAVDQVLLRRHVGDVERRTLPPHGVHGPEVEVDGPVVVHVDEIDAARAGLVRMPALGVAGVDHGGGPIAEHLSSVHVPERPVADAGEHEVCQ